MDEYAADKISTSELTGYERAGDGDAIIDKYLNCTQPQALQQGEVGFINRRSLSTHLSFFSNQRLAFS
jgi:hypothetical protein